MGRSSTGLELLLKQWSTWDFGMPSCGETATTFPFVWVVFCLLVCFF